MVGVKIGPISVPRHPGKDEKGPETATGPTLTLMQLRTGLYKGRACDF